MSQMSASEFCRRIKQQTEYALEPLHIDITIRAPRRLAAGSAGFCHIPVGVWLRQPHKERRQLASLMISPVRSEIAGGMVDSHALSLIRQVVKEYVSYVDMHMSEITKRVRDANRILSMIC